ncbi:MAG TPA: metallopeptidase TldD-related protein [Kofleriaceae bacterium]|nr:metallopeptidase TldD-related protein [Kofleriaceae bacterium]
MSGAQIEESAVRELRDIAQQTVELARRAGAEHAEVVVGAGTELTAKVRLGEPELVQEAGSRALALRVLIGGRRGVTRTSDLRREALEALCAETVTLAGFAEPDEHAAPPDPSLLARDVPDLDLYDPAVAEVDTAWALRQAAAAEASARNHDPRITNSEGATWSRSVSASAFATSGGFVGGFRSSYCSLVTEPLADDHTDPGNPKKRNGFWWTASRFLGELRDPEAVGAEAARRVVRTIGSRKVETQKCAVVFDPEIARAMIGTVFTVANGSAFWRNSSYLVGKEGERVASELVTIVDDPLIPRATGSRPFDGDGRATRKNMVIDRGVLCPVLCDTYSARKLGRPQSNCAAGRGGPTTSNFIMQAGSMTRQELLRSTSRGLYVTNLMGFGFNPVTGDFSRGAAGFWIENGELTFPVSEVTIAANFDEILKRIDAVADDLELRTSTAAPTFRVSHMTLAGTSGAGGDD